MSTKLLEKICRQILSEDSTSDWKPTATLAPSLAQFRSTAETKLQSFGRDRLDESV